MISGRQQISSPRCRTTTSSPPATRRPRRTPAARCASTTASSLQRPMRDLHALGPAGRARGVDHVGQVCRAPPPAAGSPARADLASRSIRSRHTAPARPWTGSNPSRLACVSSTDAPQSSSMNASRCAGYAGSSGTYAPPAFSVPSNPTSIAGVRSTHSPTSTPGPTPSPRSLPPTGWRARSTPRTSANHPRTPRRRSPPACAPACSSNNSCTTGVARVVARRRVPLHQHLAALVRRQQRQLRDPSRRVRPRAPRAAADSGRPGARSSRVEQVGVVLDARRATRRRSRQVHAQVELGRSLPSSMGIATPAAIAQRHRAATASETLNSTWNSGLRLRSRAA